MPFPNPDTQFGGKNANPGKPKGSLSLSTHIQNLLNDEDFTETIMMGSKGYVKFEGAPIKAIVIAAMYKAAAGDDKARDWLGKYGYGTKIELAGSVEVKQEPDPKLAKDFEDFLKKR